MTKTGLRTLATLLAVPILAAAGLALAACGESDEDKVRSVITDAVTSKDAADCSELLSPEFVERVQGVKGEQGIKRCEQQRERFRPATEANVSNLKVDGDKASADVRTKGGELNGLTLDVGLVKQDGDWKLDRVESKQ